MKIYLTNKQKLSILEEAYSRPENIRATARKYSVSDKQIRNWKKIENKLMEKSSKKLIHSGPKVKEEEHSMFVVQLIEENIARELQ